MENTVVCTKMYCAHDFLPNITSTHLIQYLFKLLKKNWATETVMCLQCIYHAADASIVL